MFLSLMECIFMARKHSVVSIRIRLNMMKVFQFIICSLESIVLFNQIIPYLHQQMRNGDNPLVIEIEDDFAKLKDLRWTSITVNRKKYDDDYDDGDYNIHNLILNDYPYVQYIKIEDYALTCLSNLTISNLPKLSTFTTGELSFNETTSLTLSSIFYLIMN